MKFQLDQSLNDLRAIFSVTKHGTMEAARAAAEAFQQEKSDAMGLTKWEQLYRELCRMKKDY